jgi:hypothetical protein
VEGMNLQPGGGRRLVLGFDAGCTTCSGLAKRIEERVGDRLEIRSLNDPTMDHWRKEALGEEAPWAPTLVELNGGPVKAWTGLRMGARLSRVLGPVATWRIMQVLGEANADLELADSASARALSGVSRGQFLKGVGGAAVAFSVLSGTGKMPSPADAAASVDHKILSGDALVEAVRRTAGREDVVNLMGKRWRDKVLKGRRFEAEISDKAKDRSTTLEAIDLGGGRISSSDGRPVFSGDLAVVKAARHALSDGNGLVAVSFVLPKSDHLLVYHEYDKPTFLPKDQVKTKSEALLYKPEGEGLVLTKASSNGHTQSLPGAEARSSSPEGRSTWCLPDRRCSNQCDIAYGYTGCARIKSISCITYECRACAITCLGGALLCAACAYIVCLPAVWRKCCTAGYTCKRCGLCR